MSQLNWKNPDNYAYLEEEKRPAVWAWEFLRRYPPYRAAYAEWAQLTDEKKKQLCFIPSKQGNEPDSIWQQRCQIEHGLEGRILSRGQWEAEQGGWLLAGMFDPDQAYNDFIEFRYTPLNGPYIVQMPEGIDPFVSKTIIDDEGGYYDEMDVITENVVIVAFDLHQPMGDQLDKIKELFKTRKKALNAKLHGNMKIKSDWIKYLRILDAFSCGADRMQIAKVFCAQSIDEEQQEDHINGLYREARKRQRNYKNILYGFRREKN